MNNYLVPWPTYVLRDRWNGGINDCQMGVNINDWNLKELAWWNCPRHTDWNIQLWNWWIHHIKTWKTNIHQIWFFTSKKLPSVLSPSTTIVYQSGIYPRSLCQFVFLWFTMLLTHLFPNDIEPRPPTGIPANGMQKLLDSWQSESNIIHMSCCS